MDDATTGLDSLFFCKEVGLVRDGEVRGSKSPAEDGS